jgi:hypothetical protein
MLVETFSSMARLMRNETDVQETVRLATGNEGSFPHRILLTGKEKTEFSKKLSVHVSM